MRSVMVKTNLGSMPIEDYREIMASKYGFDSYDELYEEGCRLGDGFDKKTDFSSLKISVHEMNEYGYFWNGMLPLTKEEAINLYISDMPVYILYPDNSEALIDDDIAFQTHDGMFGIEKTDLDLYQECLNSKKEEDISADINKNVCINNVRGGGKYGR